VQADLELGSGVGIDATPTFLFGFVQEDGSVQVVGRLAGARPYSGFKSVLDQLLAMPTK
jgi:hypothetical protein